MFEQSVHDNIVGESEGLIEEGTESLPAHFVWRITGILKKSVLGTEHYLSTIPLPYRNPFEDLDQPINFTFRELCFPGHFLREFLRFIFRRKVVG